MGNKQSLSKTLQKYSITLSLFIYTHLAPFDICLINDFEV